MKENRLISIGERNLQIESWIKDNNKIEKEQDLIKYKPTLTQYGQKQSGL